MGNPYTNSPRARTWTLPAVAHVRQKGPLFARLVVRGGSRGTGKIVCSTLYTHKLPGSFERALQEVSDKARSEGYEVQAKDYKR